MSVGYSCTGCQFADPRFTDPDDPDAECGFEIEGLCWKEVRTGQKADTVHWRTRRTSATTICSMLALTGMISERRERV